ncbi:hypothetical protein [Pseudorhodoplanes sinuspersici]|uniref:Uncharacterized protein n=1 Tax=Pseudorhodoplanes sinuspersici TaxID=1235591 RepID=A0A1W6ZVU3_9HYPH|nr:hypothetical protein [Pseudorhodoplanes sinuspersici]ARQ01398.1 hypothetical protein CAK95_21535 [Pseudorhodoplanes sinuspersici]RKE73081.1 hypothetical protein DFP91_0960 [Pseudorhodoplanes sinuspersici]
MDWLVVAGVVSLGFLVGLLVGWYVNEDQPFTATGLVASITILSGAGVLGVFHMIAPTGPTREFWLYPIAVLLGVLIAPPLSKLYDRLYVEDSKIKR